MDLQGFRMRTRGRMQGLLTSCSCSLFSRSCVGLRLLSGTLTRPRICFSHCSRPLLILSISLAISTALGSSGALFTAAEEKQSQEFSKLYTLNVRFKSLWHKQRPLKRSWSLFERVIICVMVFYVSIIDSVLILDFLISYSPWCLSFEFDIFGFIAPCFQILCA